MCFATGGWDDKGEGMFRRRPSIGVRYVLYVPFGGSLYRFPAAGLDVAAPPAAVNPVEVVGQSRRQRSS